MTFQAKTESKWLIDMNPTTFFYQKIVEAQKRNQVKLTENVEFYIVHLLCDYMQITDADDYDDCLALLLKKALESPSSQKIAHYKKLADTALYYSGFFQEYFTTKSYDIKYYVTMGISAYDELSNLMKVHNTYRATMAQIYTEMSSHFLTAVDILLDISEQTSPDKKARSTLGLYETLIGAKKC